MPHDPLWSRELSENEKRLIWNGRAEPDNPKVRKISFNLPERDAVFCHKQGMVFMEAADQGMEMNVFAPMYMQSQLAGLIDHECRKMETSVDLFKIDVVMETPEIIVGLLFWFQDFSNRLNAGDITIIRDCVLTSLPSLMLSIFSIAPPIPRNRILTPHAILSVS